MMQILKRIKSDGSNFKNLMFEFEELIFRNVKENYPDRWDEDGITTALLKDMRDLFDGKRVYLPGNVMQSRWKVFKSILEPGHWFGDIAFLFNISYHDGASTEGVAVLDVNGKDAGKSAYSTLRKDHMQRITSGAPHSQLLLYDYDAIPVLALPSQPEAILGGHPSNWDGWMPYTSAVMVPANAALALGEKTTALYKLALPLSYQFCYRYVHGLDLDYGRPSLDIITGKKPDRGRANYLVTVSIAYGGAKAKSDIEFERGDYTEL